MAVEAVLEWTTIGTFLWEKRRGTPASEMPGDLIDVRQAPARYRPVTTGHIGSF